MVYVKIVPVTFGPVRVSGVPSLVSCTSTISNDISDPKITTEFNSTVQVSITGDPTVTRFVALLLPVLPLRETAVILGTKIVQNNYDVIAFCMHVFLNIHACTL